MNTTFYRCPVCGNIIIHLIDSGVTPVCCGRPMVALPPQNVEASSSPFLDKHVPQITWFEWDACSSVDGFDSVRHTLSSVDDGLSSNGGRILLVDVGSEPHPMTPTHYVQFICLVTEHGAQMSRLSPDSRPCATFALPNKTSSRLDPPCLCVPDRPLAVYAYCNLHGLFMTPL